MLIAHLSDTHVGGRHGPEPRIEQVLAHVESLDPPADVVLVTGDITDHGTDEEFAQVRRLLDAHPDLGPVLMVPGNHDRRRGYAALRGLPAGKPLNEAHRIDGVWFLMLDSLLEPEGEGRIDEGRLAPETLVWLDEQLAARPDGEPAVVCVHHPPIALGLQRMDPIRLLDAEQLGAVLDRHDDVVAILTGHAHVALAGTFHGIPVRIPGAVATEVTLDAEPMPHITPDLPPMLAFHVLDGGSLLTFWRALPA